MKFRIVYMDKTEEEVEAENDLQAWLKSCDGRRPAYMFGWKPVIIEEEK